MQNENERKVTIILDDPVSTKLQLQLAYREIIQMKDDMLWRPEESGWYHGLTLAEIEKDKKRVSIIVNFRHIVAILVEEF